MFFFSFKFHHFSKILVAEFQLKYNFYYFDTILFLNFLYFGYFFCIVLDQNVNNSSNKINEMLAFATVPVDIENGLNKWNSIFAEGFSSMRMNCHSLLRLWGLVFFIVWKRCFLYLRRMRIAKVKNYTHQSLPKYLSLKRGWSFHFKSIELSFIEKIQTIWLQVCTNLGIFFFAFLDIIPKNFENDIFFNLKKMKISTLQIKRKSFVLNRLEIYKISIILKEDWLNTSLWQKPGERTWS